jgi:hypothetical protein
MGLGEFQEEDSRESSMPLVFLREVKISEAVILEMNQVLIGTEAL